MKISRFLILVFVLLAGKLNAQEAARRITSFYFDELYGGLIVVKAAVGKSNDTLNFILDTGSGSISVDSAAASRCGLNIIPSNDSVSGIGGFRRVNRVFNETLRFPGLTVEGLNFNVNHYDGLSASFGMRIDGLIGYSFIHRYILDVNFDSSKITVYTPGKINYPRKGFTWGFQLAYLASTPIFVRDKRPIVSQYYIDTGGGLCMLFTENFLRDSGLFSSRKRPVHTQVDGMAGKTDVRLTTVREMRLGPYKFKNVPCYLYNDKENALGYPSAAGLIGNDILRRFNWVLNYSKKEMHLVPNRFFYEEFDYAYTGLGVYQVDSTIMVTDVIANSPGERAGIQAGDIIFSVDNVLSTGVNIAQIKAALQNTRRELLLILIRNGQLTNATLKVESIL